MDWDSFGPMLVSLVFILTVGGVVLLRPISKRLAELLELYARERQVGASGELRHVRDVLETVNARLQLLEERVDFTERMLDDHGKDRRLEG